MPHHMKKSLILMAVVVLCPAVPSFADAPVSLFDGKTLNGWKEMVTPEPAFAGADITDVPGLVQKLNDKSDPVSAFVSDRLDSGARTALEAFSPTNTDTRRIKSALARNLSAIAQGPLIYDAARFQNVKLQPETAALLAGNPQGQDLVHLNKLLLEDAFPAEVARSEFKGTTNLWTVKDGVIATTGAGRGVLYTVNDYTNYRVIFTVRHISQKADHPPCVLFFCTRPVEGQRPLDELGGIQFEVPNGGNWDFRPGHNTSGRASFTACSTPNTTPPNGAAWKSWWTPGPAPRAWRWRNRRTPRRWS